MCYNCVMNVEDYREGEQQLEAEGKEIRSDKRTHDNQEVSKNVRLRL